MDSMCRFEIRMDSTLGRSGFRVAIDPPESRKGGITVVEGGMCRRVGGSRGCGWGGDFRGMDGADGEKMS